MQQIINSTVNTEFSKNYIEYYDVSLLINQLVDIDVIFSNTLLYEKDSDVLPIKIDINKDFSVNDYIVVLSSQNYSLDNCDFIKKKDTIIKNNFDGIDIGNSYTDGSFTINGYEWFYTHARNVDTFGIDGEGIMLRRATEPSSLKIILQNGIKSFYVDTKKAFTGNNQRQLELVINGDVVAQFTPDFGDGLDNNTLPFFVDNINIYGVVDLEIRVFGNNDNRQIVLDNITIVELYDESQITDFSEFESTVIDENLLLRDYGINGNTITIANGVDENKKFDKFYYDKNFKMTSFSSLVDNSYRATNNEKTVYDLILKNEPLHNKTVENENFIDLYGSYFKGFFKLFGEDFEIIKERKNIGWSSVMLVRPREITQQLNDDLFYINDIHENNRNTFFFIGSRSENKFDPNKNDVFSNAFSVKFEGNPLNPKICVRLLKYKNECIENVTCDDVSNNLTETYDVVEYCGDSGIYDICDINDERWVKVSVVFERNIALEDCDLENYGGVNDMRTRVYKDSVNFVENKDDERITQTILNKKWYDNVEKRLGKLYVYVNNYLYMIINDFEEVIPRELNTSKEQQYTVPFNLSFGGGSVGLREHTLIDDNGFYQDSELINSENSFIEKNFGGTFDGSVSMFNFYTIPLDFTEVKHNFKILKERYDLLDFDCPNC